ncbi:hypothetical protein BGZ70_009913 [Mortierella alpina]|uniref:Dienelactone hydrolase domain-containing protein n=1 Tax=Mortierella alpina TaxID=64518 RepID=A0A9P6J0I5_MORAP|nr:hypothetical protein BGZ70_009913 [Mortierella alpina]
MSALTHACCSKPPTDTQWQRKGEDRALTRKVNGEERRAYRTGPRESKRGIIAIYDIFGFHPTGIQFYDRLAMAHGGFQVSAPYLFKQIMPQSLLGNREGVMAWLSEHGDYKNTHFDEVIRAAVEDLRADGCTSISIVGQCWGTFIAIKAASEDDSPFLAAGGPHPSFTTVDSVKDIKCPLILFPSKDEQDMVPVIEAVNEKRFSIKSMQQRFDTMHHGWTSSRGDWSDPEQLQAGLEAVHLLAEFFAQAAEMCEKSE